VGLRAADWPRCASITYYLSSGRGVCVFIIITLNKARKGSRSGEISASRASVRFCSRRRHSLRLTLNFARCVLDGWRGLEEHGDFVADRWPDNLPLPPLTSQGQQSALPDRALTHTFGESRLFLSLRLLFNLCGNLATLVFV